MAILVRHPSVERLHRAELTYPEVGATAGELPSGYRHVVRDAVLGHGADVFDRCVRALLHWDVHRGAGLDVRASRTPRDPRGGRTDPRGVRLRHPARPSGAGGESRSSSRWKEPEPSCSTSRPSPDGRTRSAGCSDPSHGGCRTESSGATSAQRGKSRRRGRAAPAQGNSTSVEKPETVPDEVVSERAVLLPEEKAAGPSADPQGQAAAILADSEERVNAPHDPPDGADPQ